MLHGFGKPDELEKLKSDFAAKYDVKVGLSTADLAGGRKSAEQLRDDVSAAFDGKSASILVNNAGIQHVSSVEDFPEDMFEKVIAVNLSAVFYTTQAFLPAMKESGWGRMIHVASAHGLVASANKSAYVASKHGVMGLSKVVGVEAAGTGVTSNVVCPGWVLTPLVEKQVQARADSMGVSFEEAKVDLLSEKQPQREFATPEDIGHAVSFFCGPGSGAVTGTHLSVDGGWTAI